MTEQRRYTVDEANDMLPKVIPLLEALRDAQAVMEEHQDAVMTSAPTNGGGPVHQAFLDASLEAARSLDALAADGILVRDPAEGLIDFPAERDGQPVYLCWRLGEGDIGWWHPPGTGFAGRQPL